MCSRFRNLHMKSGMQSVESMDDRNMVYHIGNAGRNMEPDVMDYYSDYESDDGYRKLNNLVYFLDFDQADHHLSKIERQDQV